MQEAPVTTTSPLTRDGFEELRRQKRRLQPSYIKRVERSRLPRKQARLSPQQIRQLRTQLGMTQAEFGRRLWVDRVTVIRWERGQRVPMNKYFKVMRVWAGLDQPGHKAGSL